MSGLPSCEGGKRGALMLPPPGFVRAVPATRDAHHGYGLATGAA